LDSRPAETVENIPNMSEDIDSDTSSPSAPSNYQPLNGSREIDFDISDMEPDESANVNNTERVEIECDSSPSLSTGEKFLSPF